jgi:hypothetical protein
VNLERRRMPGFTANLSLYQTRRSYRTTGGKGEREGLLPALTDRQVRAQDDNCCGDPSYCCPSGTICLTDSNNNNIGCCDGTVCADDSGDIWGCAGPGSICCGSSSICNTETSVCCPDGSGDSICVGRTGSCLNKDWVCVAPGECRPHFIPWFIISKIGPFHF